MKETTTFLLGAALLSGAISASAEIFQLTTKSTALTFERTEFAGADRIFLKHFGPKTDAASAASLAWLCESSSSVSHELPLAYLAFGGTGGSPSPFGGLSVIHDDGVTTLDLAVETLDRADDAVTVVWKDVTHDFRLVQHFRARPAEDVIETWVELKNGERGAVRIPRMSSFAFGFPLLAQEWHLQNAAAQWGAEGQLRTTKIERGTRVVIDSRSGVRDAFMNNPSFMLSIGEPSTETRGRVLGGVLAWTGAWEMGFRRSQTDFFELTAGPANLAGPYVLDAGGSITLPLAALTYVENGRGQVSRNIHRWARNHWLPNGRKLRPTLLNNWEGTGMAFSEEKIRTIMDGAKEAGVEMFVLDDGWFGRGDFARETDDRGLGDWVVNEKKLPHGLKGLAADAAARGLKFGFWVEPENGNVGKSELLVAHPDWCLREKGRKMRLGRGGTQAVLDLVNPAVRDNIWGQLDAAYASVPSLAYVKWDSNCDMNNVGSPFLDDAHQANVYFDYTKGYYDLLARQRAKYPAVDIQACSSGGGHMDYGSLRYCDEFWTSDDTDARERVQIQWGASQFYPACAMASHVTMGWRPTPFNFRVNVALSGRFGLEMQPCKMKKPELALVKNALAEYKRLRPVIQLGDLYRLVSPYEHDHAALMYVSEDRSQAVVFVYGLSRHNGQDFPTPLMLQGLDPARRYRLRELNTEAWWPKAHSRLLAKPADFRAEMKEGVAPLTGDALMKLGLPFTLAATDYDSLVFELTAVR